MEPINPFVTFFSTIAFCSLCVKYYRVSCAVFGIFFAGVCAAVLAWSVWHMNLFAFAMAVFAGMIAEMCLRVAWTGEPPAVDARLQKWY